MHQVLDEAIASTDSEIAGLQADALHGEGVICGMQATKQPVKGPRLDAEVLSLLLLLYWYKNTNNDA